jgi:hypothetical protein
MNSFEIFQLFQKIYTSDQLNPLIFRQKEILIVTGIR